MQDDVPEEVKQRRLREMITVCRDGMAEINATHVGARQLVLLEGVSCHVAVFKFSLSPLWYSAALAMGICGKGTSGFHTNTLRRGLESPISNKI